MQTGGEERLKHDLHVAQRHLDMLKTVNPRVQAPDLLPALRLARLAVWCTASVAARSRNNLGQPLEIDLDGLSYGFPKRLQLIMRHVTCRIIRGSDRDLLGDEWETWWLDIKPGKAQQPVVWSQSYQRAISDWVQREAQRLAWEVDLLLTERRQLNEAALDEARNANERVKLHRRSEEKTLQAGEQLAHLKRFCKAIDQFYEACQYLGYLNPLTPSTKACIHYVSHLSIQSLITLDPLQTPVLLFLNMTLHPEQLQTALTTYKHYRILRQSVEQQFILLAELSAALSNLVHRSRELAFSVPLPLRTAREAGLSQIRRIAFDLRIDSITSILHSFLENPKIPGLQQSLDNLSTGTLFSDILAPYIHN